MTNYVYVERENGRNVEFQFKRFSIYSLDGIKLKLVADVDGVTPWCNDKTEALIKLWCQKITDDDVHAAIQSP